MTYIYYANHEDLNFYVHTHSNCEIVCISDGSMIVSVNHTDVEIKKGEGIFLPPYYTHAFKTPVRSGCMIWEFTRNAIHENLPSHVTVFKCDNNLLEAVTNAVSDNDFFSKKAAIYTLASMVNSDSIHEYNYVSNEICEKAVYFIADNFANPITLMDAAKYCHVNYSYLSRVFAEKEGITFNQCLNGTRLNYATSMLMNTNKSVTEIALECGFGSIRNFNRIFLRDMKMTPSDFRKNGSANPIQTK